MLLIGVFLACCVALVFVAKVLVDPGKGPRSPDGWRAGLVVLWLGIPILGTFVASVLWTPSFLPRYLIVALPAPVTLAALGVSTLHPHALQAVALALLVALSIPALAS